MTLPTDLLIYFILFSLLAEIVGTVGGFGSSLLFIPIAGFFFDFHSVLGITALYHLSSNVSKIALFRKGFNKKLILSIGIPAVVFVIAGSFATKYVNSQLLEIMMVVFLISLSLFLLFFPGFSFKPTIINSVTGGSLSGLAAGLVGTGGAIRGLTMAAFNLEKEIFIATSAVIDLGIDLSRSAVYFSNGYVHSHDLYLVPLLLIVSVIGTYAGKKILARISEKQFKRFTLVLIMGIGVLTIINQVAK